MRFAPAILSAVHCIAVASAPYPNAARRQMHAHRKIVYPLGQAMCKRRSNGRQDDMPYAEAFFHFSQAYRKEVQPAQGFHRILRRSAQRSQKGKGNSSKGEGNFAPCHAGNTAIRPAISRFFDRLREAAKGASLILQSILLIFPSRRRASKLPCCPSWPPFIASLPGSCSLPEAG